MSLRLKTLIASRGSDYLWQAAGSSELLISVFWVDVQTNVNLHSLVELCACSAERGL